MESFQLPLALISFSATARNRNIKGLEETPHVGRGSWIFDVFAFDFYDKYKVIGSTNQLIIPVVTKIPANMGSDSVFVTLSDREPSTHPLRMYCIELRSIELLNSGKQNSMFIFLQIMFMEQKTSAVRVSPDSDIDGLKKNVFVSYRGTVGSVTSRIQCFFSSLDKNFCFTRLFLLQF